MKKFNFEKNKNSKTFSFVRMSEKNCFVRNIEKSGEDSGLRSWLLKEVKEEFKVKTLDKFHFFDIVKCI